MLLPSGGFDARPISGVSRCPLADSVFMLLIGIVSPGHNPLSNWREVQLEVRASGMTLVNQFGNGPVDGFNLKDEMS